MTEPAAAPLLSVVRGQPSPEQLAALLVVLARRGPAFPVPAPGVSAPGVPAPGRRWRTPLRPALPAPGPGAWRASALPV